MGTPNAAAKPIAAVIIGIRILIAEGTAHNGYTTFSMEYLYFSTFKRESQGLIKKNLVMKWTQRDCRRILQALEEENGSCLPCAPMNLGGGRRDYRRLEKIRRSRPESPEGEGGVTKKRADSSKEMQKCAANKGGIFGIRGGYAGQIKKYPFSCTELLEVV